MAKIHSHLDTGDFSDFEILGFWLLILNMHIPLLSSPMLHHSWPSITFATSCVFGRRLCKAAVYCLLRRASQCQLCCEAAVERVSLVICLFYGTNSLHQQSSKSYPCSSRHHNRQIVHLKPEKENVTQKFPAELFILLSPLITSRIILYSQIVNLSL